MLTSILLALTAAVTGPADTATSRTICDLPQCNVTLIQHVEVPARQPGVLTSLSVVEGTTVEAGQVVGEVDRREAELRRHVAELEHQAAAKRSARDIEVEEARKAAKVAAAEVAGSEYINSRVPGSIPPTELRRQRLTMERLELQTIVAEMEFDVAKITTDTKLAQTALLDHEIDTRSVTAPIAGEIVQLYRQPGEWVQAGEPVVRIVRMDRLRVEGFVGADEFLPEDLFGCPVKVIIERPGESERTLRGRITYVSPQVEASNEFRVWAEVENEHVVKDGRKFWVLRAGMKATMSIALDDAS